VTSTQTINAIVIFEQNATNQTTPTHTASKLIAYIDNVSSGFPIPAPSGANITISWDGSQYRIFSL
jgi:hypothetical protein